MGYSPQDDQQIQRKDAELFTWCQEQRRKTKLGGQRWGEIGRVAFYCRMTWKEFTEEITYSDYLFAVGEKCSRWEEERLLGPEVECFCKFEGRVGRSLPSVWLGQSQGGKGAMGLEVSGFGRLQWGSWLLLGKSSPKSWDQRIGLAWLGR